jgi:Ca2+-dependent lipid-binding protein
MFNEYFSTLITWETLKIEPTLALFFSPPNIKRLYVSLPQFEDEPKDAASPSKEKHKSNATNTTNNGTISPSSPSQKPKNGERVSSMQGHIKQTQTEKQSQSAKQQANDKTNDDGLDEHDRQKDEETKNKFQQARSKANTLTINIDNSFRLHYARLQEIKESLGLFCFDCFFLCLLIYLYFSLYFLFPCFFYHFLFLLCVCLN